MRPVTLVPRLQAASGAGPGAVASYRVQGDYGYRGTDDPHGNENSASSVAHFFADPRHVSEGRRGVHVRRVRP